MSRHNLALVDAMPAATDFSLELAAGTPFELLIGLYAVCARAGRETWAPPDVAACPPATRAALAAVGDRSGELWLHLLGLALEAQAPDAESFVEHVAGVRAPELRNHLLGLYVPSWRRVVGVGTIARAARGDAAAAGRLLRDRRYYGGSARESLAKLMPLGARETKARVLAALGSFVSEVLTPREPDLRERLNAERGLKERLVHDQEALAVIEQAAVGYRYEPEPEFPRVVLVPHLAAGPAILLCQHRDVRLICYPADAAEPDLLAIGRALADEKRVAILERLRAGDATLGELAAGAGVAKSTTHHHLAQLRAAGFVRLRGNAAGYAYRLDPAGVATAARLLGNFARGAAAGSRSSARLADQPP
jgi:DNA-binding transcriptional ArsR family regulator